MEKDSALKYILATPEELREIITDTLQKELSKFLNISANLKQPTEEEYLSRQSAAAFLHCSLVTLYNYEKKGTLVPLRLGRKILYSKQSLLDAMRGIDSS